MTAEDDALAALRETGLLDVLKWGAPVAFDATDQGVVGYLNFKHLKDLIDRATSNGRFKLGEGLGSNGADVLERGITPDAFYSMPRLEPDAVVRHDYNQSPGWVAGGYRVLLQSYPFGKIDDIKWGQVSSAKRQAAEQFFNDGNTLFSPEDFGLETLSGIPDDDFDGVSLIAAHAFNPATKQFELYIGLSKNPGYVGDACWHWKTLLLSGGSPMGGTSAPIVPTMPGGGASVDVEDVPVRIKRTDANEGADAENG
jgi:hypothetical protein